MQSQIENLFKDLDADFTAKQIKWAAERVTAIKEFKATADRRALGEGEYYRQIWAVAGGKTWYNLFDGRNWAMIEPLVEKNCQRIFSTRNANIIAKLKKMGATEILDLENARSNGGIDGWFTVVTDQGKTTVTIETIIAGGYNIQCLHHRVLVNGGKVGA